MTKTIDKAEQLSGDKFTLEVYQVFMSAYVRRVNEATLNVAIGGVRIGSAKYSRLAQINLQSKIITFSRFAVENVPERGRRYLVIHELAHVQEPSHNKNFWQIVARYEPNYRKIGKLLDEAFKNNVKNKASIDNQSISANLLLSGTSDFLSKQIEEDGGEEDLLCTDDKLNDWDDCDDGVLSGGLEADSISIVTI